MVRVKNEGLKEIKIGVFDFFKVSVKAEFLTQWDLAEINKFEVRIIY